MSGNGPMVDGGSQPPVEDPQSISGDATLLREGSSFPPGAHDPLIGQVIAERYRVDELIGQGGMGRVFKAVHIHMHKTVALKVLRPEMTAVRGVLQRFEREAVAAGRISHVNVVAATDFGRIDADNSFYLVLEYVDGVSLRREMKKGPFTVARTVNVARQICEALVAAHQQGVIHRDLKPDNILLVDDNGRDLVKVLDFGIAKFSDGAAEPGEHQTRFGVVMGTPRYMSPEQATGSAVDHRTDLYALGVILFEMLAGRAPFVATEVNAILSQQLISEPPPLPPHVGPDLARLCRQLLAKDAADRPGTAAEVLERLEAINASAERSRAQTWRWPAISIERLPEWARRGASSVSPSLVRVSSVASTAWRRVRFLIPALAVLERPVVMGKRAVPVGVFVAGACAAIAVIGFAFTRRSDPTHPDSAAEPASTSTPQTVKEEPKPVPDEISREELDDLLAIPVYKRDRQQWLTIAAAHAHFEEWKQSIAAYRNALQLDPSLKNDPRLLQRVRDLALRHEVYEAVANVALNLLGEPGLDLMYDVWLATREDDSKVTIATSAEKSLGIFRLRGASPALRVALALQFAKPDECEEVNKALTDALKYADERAVPELEKLRVRTGCGVSKRRDCYACIREREADLETAIRLAKNRRAPLFDGERYVPGHGG